LQTRDARKRANAATTHEADRACITWVDDPHPGREKGGISSAPRWPHARQHPQPCIVTCQPRPSASTRAAAPACRRRMMWLQHASKHEMLSSQDGRTACRPVLCALATRPLAKHLPPPLSIRTSGSPTDLVAADRQVICNGILDDLEQLHAAVSAAVCPARADAEVAQQLHHECAEPTIDAWNACLRMHFDEHIFGRSNVHLKESGLVQWAVQQHQEALYVGDSIEGAQDIARVGRMDGQAAKHHRG